MLDVKNFDLRVIASTSQWTMSTQEELPEDFLSLEDLSDLNLESGVDAANLDFYSINDVNPVEINRGVNTCIVSIEHEGDNKLVRDKTYNFKLHPSVRSIKLLGVKQQNYEVLAEFIIASGEQKNMYWDICAGNRPTIKFLLSHYPCEKGLKKYKCYQIMYSDSVSEVCVGQFFVVAKMSNTTHKERPVKRLRQEEEKLITTDPDVIIYITATHDITGLFNRCELPNNSSITIGKFNGANLMLNHKSISRQLGLQLIRNDDELRLQIQNTVGNPVKINEQEHYNGQILLNSSSLFRYRDFSFKFEMM